MNDLEIVDIINNNNIKKLVSALESKKIDVNHRFMSLLGQPTLLMDAIYYEKKDMIITLLNYGADINAIDSNNYSAFTNAIMKRNIDILKLLVDRGCNINAPDRWNRTPLMMSIFFQDIKLTKYLIKIGCDQNGKDNNGRTLKSNIKCWFNYRQRKDIKNFIIITESLLHKCVKYIAKNRSKYDITVLNRDIIKLLNKFDESNG